MGWGREERWEGRGGDVKEGEGKAGGKGKGAERGGKEGAVIDRNENILFQALLLLPYPLFPYLSPLPFQSAPPPSPRT